ncbi:MAG TPA: hypothetical protein VE093_38495 [Polyangiaceae bacterium]|jgi:hypothetical protein|nr:hypothetical protein [Polyangiaceae bacterium]
MHQLTTITRTTSDQLPESLALLAAPLIGEHDSPETEPLGRVEGAIVDEAGHVAFFVVRVAQHMRLTGKRILCPLAAVRLEETASRVPNKILLRTSWTLNQLLAQPDFVEDHELPRNRTDGSPPVEGRWMPAVPNAIPPGSGVNRSKALLLGMKWGIPAGIIGGLMGALIGYVAGSAFAMLTTAVFFGLASAIAGLIAGATRDSAVDAGEIHAMNPATAGPGAVALDNAGTAGMPYVMQLENALNDRSLFNTGVLKATPIQPTTQKVRSSDNVETPSILEASKPLRT